MMNHPSKEGGLFVSEPYTKYFSFLQLFFTTFFGFLI